MVSNALIDLMDRQDDKSLKFVELLNDSGLVAAYKVQTDGDYNED